MVTENITIKISAEDELTSKIQQISESLLQLQDVFKGLKFELPPIDTKSFEQSISKVKDSVQELGTLTKNVPEIKTPKIEGDVKQIKNLSINLKELEGINLKNIDIGKEFTGFNIVKKNIKDTSTDLADLNRIVGGIDFSSLTPKQLDEAVTMFRNYKNEIKQTTQVTQDNLKAWRKDIGVFDQMNAPIKENISGFNNLNMALKKAGISQKDFAVWQRKNFFTMDDGVQLTNQLTKQTLSYGRAAAQAKMDSRRFKMEWLSVMFAGMQLERTFGGMLQPVMQLLGWFDIWGAILQSVLLPVLLPFTDILIAIFDWINGLTDEQKRWIGSFIVAIAVVGTLMATLGMFMLFVNQLTQLLDNIIPEEMLNNLSIFGISLGELPGTILNSIIALLGFGGSITGVAGLISLLTGGLINLTGEGEETGDIFGGLGGIFGGLGKSIEKIIPGIGDFGKKIGDVFEIIKLVMTGKWSEAWQKIKDLLGPNITWVKDKIITGLKWIWEELKKVLPPWMVDAIEKGWEALTTWIKDLKNAKSLGDAIYATVKLIDTWGQIGLYIAQQMVEYIMQNLPKLLASALKGLGKLFGIGKDGDIKLKGFQFGGMVPETGPYILHRGEEVIPANQVGGSTASVIYFTPTANINATVSSSYDVRQLADELNTYWAQDFQRMMRSRGSI